MFCVLSWIFLIVLSIFISSFGSLVGGNVEEGQPIQSSTSAATPPINQQPSSTARKKYASPTVI